MRTTDSRELYDRKPGSGEAGSHTHSLIAAKFLVAGYDRLGALIIRLFLLSKSENSTVNKPIQVLIIDDDVTMREAIGYVLEDLAVEFDAVSSGEEGLAKLEEEHYDLVLLDLVIHTGAHGTKIYSKICSRQRRPNVVFMTASASREPIFVEAVELEVRILRKPFSLDEFEQIVNGIKGKLNQP